MTRGQLCPQFKNSTLRGRHITDERALRATVFEYIEIFYNRYRKHSSLNYQSPIQYEEKIYPPWGTPENKTLYPKQAI